MRRNAVLPLILLLLLGAAAAADEDGDLTLRSLDVSVLSAPRVHRYGPPLGAPGTYAFDEQSEPEHREPEVFLPTEYLVELIQESVESASWEEHGELHYSGSRIFARNRGHVLRKVEEFVNEAELAASRRVLLDVKVVSIADGKVGTDAELIQAAKSGSLLESGSIETYPGIQSSLKVTNRVRYIRDYDVEIAQTASIADPVIGAAEEGFVVDVTPHPTLDGKRVLVEALLRRGTFERPFRSLDLADSEGKLGRLDLPTFHHVAAFTSDVVESGGTIAVPFAGEDGMLVVLIRPRVLGRGSGRFLDVGAICRAPFRCTVGTHPDADPVYARMMAPQIGVGEEPPPLGGIEGLLELTVSSEDPWYWEEEGRIAVANESHLFVKANEEVLARVRRFLSEREAEALRPIELDLRVYSVEGSVEAGAKSAFDDAGATLLRAGRVSALPGRSSLVVAGNTMNYVADYDVEVAQEAQIADPIVGQSFEGLAANLIPRLSVDGTTVRVEVGLLYAERTLSKEPMRSNAMHVGTIDGVSEKRTVLNETVEFPTGSIYVLDAGPAPASTGRLAVVLSARVD